MAKHTVTGFITYLKYEWDEKPIIGFSMVEPSGKYSVAVRPHSFEVEVPDNFNPVPQQVAALEAEKKEAQLECARKLMSLDVQISKLQALTFEAA